MQAGEPENAGRLKQSCEFCIKFRLYIEYMVTARVSRISSIIYLFIYVLPNEVISSEGAGRNLPQPNLKNWPGICLEGRRKSMKNLSQLDKICIQDIV